MLYIYYHIMLHNILYLIFLIYLFTSNIIRDPAAHRGQRRGAPHGRGRGFKEQDGPGPGRGAGQQLADLAARGALQRLRGVGHRSAHGPELPPVGHRHLAGYGADRGQRHERRGASWRHV